MHQTYLPPATTWGSSTAKRRAICLHGLTSSSGVWCNVADGLADNGYFVTAPDLLGHGLSRRPAASASYTISAYAEDLKPLLSTSQPYDTVLGHSFGGAVALALAPMMLAAGAPFVHVVLVEPALELTDEQLEEMRVGSIDEVTNVRTWQKYMEENPLWHQKDAIVKNFGATTCWEETADQVCKQNQPWSFTKLMPSPSPNIHITILAADPLLMPYFTPRELAAINAKRPDIRTSVINGCSHAMPREFPFAVVQEVLKDREGFVDAPQNEEAEWKEEVNGAKGRKKEMNLYRHAMFHGMAAPSMS